MSKRTSISYGVMVGCVAVLLSMMSSAPMGVSSGLDVLYTLDADFDQGTLFNVNHDAPNPNQLQLNTQLTTFPVMWIANAGEDSLSKVDTDTGRELARYWTFAPRPGHINSAYSGPAPSRTAVDSDGNAYVANRHFDGQVPSIMKVLAQGFIDRNGNGVMDTSTDLNNDGVISGAEIMPLVDANANGQPDNDGPDADTDPDDSEIKDERIAWIRRAGSPNGLGRSLCLDNSGNLWIGMYNTRQYYKVSSVNGATLAGPISTGSHTPYGCAVDSTGMLWSASLTNNLGQLNTLTDTYVTTRVHDGSTDYGITIGKGLADEIRVYQSNFNFAYTYFTPSTNSFTNIPTSGMISIGVAVDSANNLIAGQDSGGTRKRDVNGAILWTAPTVPGTSGARGTIVDSNNDVWRINLFSHNIAKLRGSDGALLGVFPIGNSPYTYSDATGLTALNNTQPSGTWTVEQDGGVAGAIWDSVTWNTEPQGATANGSTITGRVRAADVIGDLSSQPWTAVTNGGPIAGVTGQFIQVEMKLTAGTNNTSPILSDVRVVGHSPNSPPTAVCQDVTVGTGPAACSASASVNNGSSDPDGDPLTFLQVPPGPYALGSTAVSLTVTDPAGLSASCNATVTVIDDAPPSITCPAPATIECTGPGTFFTPGAATATDNCSVTTTGPGAGSFPLGTTTLAYSATDGVASVSCTSAVTVVDTTPPTISTVTNSFATIWPPNHAMIPLNLSVTAADACSGTVAAGSCRITNITSDEAINAQGDGNTDPDWIIGTGLNASIRAERQGSGDGRVYTITVVCQDPQGNDSAPMTTTVAVPHSGGK